MTLKYCRITILHLKKCMQLTLEDSTFHYSFNISLMYICQWGRKRKTKMAIQQGYMWFTSVHKWMGIFDVWSVYVGNDTLPLAKKKFVLRMLWTVLQIHSTVKFAWFNGWYWGEPIFRLVCFSSKWVQKKKWIGF